MIEEGQVVLFSFPQTNQGSGKLRPALVLRKCPGLHDDWLICMISSRLNQEIPGTDEIVREEDDDFVTSGLKTSSLVRITRLAVVSSDILHGSIGRLHADRTNRIRFKLAGWIGESP